ncbi:MAG: zinc ribbon domain-containing protein [Geodermatophilaceae bacterium]|nr:zinc ribbon domain-containing protein [Geodermatophilaceae bacterium]
MASYDYRCRTCDHVFEVRRSVTEQETSPDCPYGHADVTRVWSAVALAGAATGGPSPGRRAAPAGGCCGGGCCG